MMSMRGLEKTEQARKRDASSEIAFIYYLQNSLPPVGVGRGRGKTKNGRDPAREPTRAEARTSNWGQAGAGFAGPIKEHQSRGTAVVPEARRLVVCERESM